MGNCYEKWRVFLNRPPLAVDSIQRKTSRAKLMVIVRRILNKYGYPPDKQRQAVELVMKQAEHLADVWTEKIVSSNHGK
jgi:type I restriction enzyme R subunit